MNRIQTTLTVFGYIGVAAITLVAINNPKPTVATESSPVVYSDRIETTTFMDQTITVNCTDPQVMSEKDGIWYTRDDVIKQNENHESEYAAPYAAAIFDMVYDEACN